MVTPRVRTIVVPLDFELASLAALERAVSLASRFGARVVPLHVHTPAPAAPGLAGRCLERYRQLQRNAVAKATAETLKRWGLAIEYRPGAPANVIVQATDELDADLVVMGTHGRHGPSRLLFGSVAEAVLRKSEVPVLLVRQAAAMPPNRVVLCATDLSPAARVVTARARQLADAIGAHLELLHACALPFASYPGIDVGLAASAVGDLERLATAELAATAQRVGATRRHLVIGDAASAILQTAQQVNPLFVVVGTERRRGIARLYLGSVAEWVLRRCPFPVLVVPTDAEVEVPEVRVAGAPTAASSGARMLS